MGQRLCTEKKFKKIAREIEFPPSNISWSKGRENINMTFKTSNLQLSEQRIPQVFFAQLIVAAKTLLVFAEFFPPENIAFREKYVREISQKCII